MIDQYTKFPVVNIVKSTGWETLRPVLEDALATHGIPDIITTDGGPPHNGEERVKKTKKCERDIRERMRSSRCTTTRGIRPRRRS